MADDQFCTLTEDGETGNYSHSGRYSQITIGSEGHADFGGGSLNINKRTLGDGIHTIRTITADDYVTLTNKTLRLELPNATRIFATLSGATSPDLYVEFRNQLDGD